MIPWRAIADSTRPITKGQKWKDTANFIDIQAHNFLRGYRRDLQQSQPDHIELIVEKLTVRSIIEPVALKYCIPMTVGRGYCSITPRYDIVQRYKQSAKDRLILLIASDFDPDGEEIAEGLARSIRDDFEVDEVIARKVLLRDDQIRDWKLPNNGLEAKEGASKYKKFVERYGEQVFELESVPPDQMQAAVDQAIEESLDIDKFNNEIEVERNDAVRIQSIKQTIFEAFPDLSGNESS